MRTLPLVARGVIAAGIFMSGQAFGQTLGQDCLNADGAADAMMLAGARPMHEFVEDDGLKAVEALNLFTMPGAYYTGDQMFLWSGQTLVSAAILSRNGGGFCLSALVMLTPWQAERIADAVLGQ